LIQPFGNVGYLHIKVHDHLFALLKAEADVALANNKVFSSGLTDFGVAHHREVESPEVLSELQTTMFSLIQKYREGFQFDPSDTRTNTNNLPFVLGKPWINYQKKHEFIPNHYHEGVFSYSIWVKIPYPREGKYAGNFEFSYGRADGLVGTQAITPIEGQMLFFPSRVFHQVYPFYGSDDVRVAVSGNILLNSDG